MKSKSESISQQAIIKWWGYAHKGFGVPENLLMAFPLQGARTPRNGARMKAEGMRRGTPDMFLAIARKGTHGLWIEMKSQAGKITPEQNSILHDLGQQDYHSIVCRSSAEAIELIEHYLSLK